MNRFHREVGFGKQIFFLLIGAYLLLAPLSVSGARSRDGDDLIKWFRVADLVMIGLFGLQWFRVSKHSPTTLKLMGFAVFFTVSASWSSSPMWGLAFKGMFFASVIGGITLGCCLRSGADFQSFGRAMTTSATIAIAGVAYILVTQENDLMLRGRLTVGQINPNLLAQSSTVFALLCIFHMLIPDRPRWKTQAGLCLIALLVITLLTGSRGAVLMLFSGILFLLPVLGRKRRQVIFLAFCSGLLLITVSAAWFSDDNSVAEGPSNSQTDIAFRIVDELTKDTRQSIWGYAISQSAKSPVIGLGWMHRNNRGANVQSAYLQILAESGLIGLGLFAFFVLETLGLIYRCLRLGRTQTGLGRSLMLVFSATAAAMLLHGVFESSLVTGASPNAIILGFCISQLDYLRAMTERRRGTNYAPASTFNRRSFASS